MDFLKIRNFLKRMFFLKAKKILFLFFIALPVLVLGRFIQLFSLIDPSTGFFLDDQMQFNIFISILLAVIPILFILFSYFKNDYTEDISFRSIGFGVVSLLFGFVFLIESAYIAISGQLFTLSNEAGYSIFSFQALLYMLLCILSALGFCLQAASCFGGIKKGMFLMIFPVITWIYRLISSFISFTGIANISENIIEIFMLCTSLLFLLAHGKAVNNIECKKNLRMATAFGLAAASLCAVSTLPRYILLIMGRTDLLHEGKSGSILDIGLLIYAVCFLFFALKKQKSNV